MSDSSLLFFFETHGAGFLESRGCFRWLFPVSNFPWRLQDEIFSPAPHQYFKTRGETQRKAPARLTAAYSLGAWVPAASLQLPQAPLRSLAVITGQQRGGVISARTRIDVLLDSFRKKQPFTHFLSFALTQPEVQERFLQFKEEVLEKCSKVSTRLGSKIQLGPCSRLVSRSSSLAFPRGASLFITLPSRVFFTGLSLKLVGLL